MNGNVFSDIESTFALIRRREDVRRDEPQPSPLGKGDKRGAAPVSFCRVPSDITNSNCGIGKTEDDDENEDDYDNAYGTNRTDGAEWSEAAGDPGREDSNKRDVAASNSSEAMRDPILGISGEWVLNNVQ
jgi:hypothetical protein